MSIDLPIGTQPMYLALRDAGISTAQPLRNVPWVALADDGTTVMNIWRSQIETRNGTLVAVIDARGWSTKGGLRESKRHAVVDALSARDGQEIRVLILEESALNSRKRTGARYDSATQWLVEDTGEEFLLWRGRRRTEEGPPIPPTPGAFGHLNPDRKEVVSRRIERDPRVRGITLLRSNNRCEVPECADGADFETLDVHHITHLGNGGADHTDNTIALCPACHARVHRGTSTIKGRLEVSILRVRNARRPTR